MSGSRSRFRPKHDTRPLTSVRIENSCTPLPFRPYTQVIERLVIERLEPPNPIKSSRSSQLRFRPDGVVGYHISLTIVDNDSEKVLRSSLSLVKNFLGHFWWCVSHTFPFCRFLCFCLYYSGYVDFFPFCCYFF